MKVEIKKFIIFFIFVLFCSCIIRGSLILSEDKLSANNEVANIKSSKLLKIDKNKTYKEIIDTLGKTKDIGNDDIHIAHYIVDKEKDLYITITDINEECILSGEELLQTATPIINKISIRGTVSNLVINKNSATFTVEGIKEIDTEYDIANVTANRLTKVGFGCADSIGDNGCLNTTLLDYYILANGDNVEILFDEVLETYPVQAKAKTILILKNKD